MTWISYGMAARLVSKVLLPYLHYGFVEHLLLQYPNVNSGHSFPSMGTKTLGATCWEGSEGQSEMWLDLNPRREKYSTPKNQEKQPAAGASAEKLQLPVLNEKPKNA